VTHSLEVSVESHGKTILVSAESYEAKFVIDEPFAWTRQRCDFAAFAFLPIAMRLKRPLRIVDRGDTVTAKNAMRLSQVWQTWHPTLFHSIDVGFAEETPMPIGSGELVLFSGGVDSTFNLLNKRLRNEEQPTALTVHGFDYKFNDEVRFQALLEKTQPFCSHVAKQRIIAHTNIYDLYNRLGINAGLGHGFALASCLFLFSDQFARGEISADYSRAQDFLVFPWGTNHLTNPLFASSAFGLHTADGDMTRSEKTALIANNSLALESLSFCVDYKSRPLNCGICPKCIRTKAMFIARTGIEPKIFKIPGLTAAQLATWDFVTPYQRAFFLDVYQSAEEFGNLAKLPQIQNLANKFFSHSRFRTTSRVISAIPKIFKQWLERKG
jgi:hypothetical protein